jgi:hypothetical protein
MVTLGSLQICLKIWGDIHKQGALQGFQVSLTPVANFPITWKTEFYAVVISVPRNSPELCGIRFVQY